MRVSPSSHPTFRVTRVGTHELIVALLSSYAGFILEKNIAVNSPRRIENAKIMIANTCESPSTGIQREVRVQPLTCLCPLAPLAMDTDKIKIFGARVRVDGTGKLAELERAEKVRPS
jgi:T-complex protein 1 subunit beta